jgi:AGCS family alanine or glycine:cation symporter
VESLIEAVNSFLWGKFLWMFIIAIGLFLNIRLFFMPLRKIGYAFRQLWKGRRAKEVSGISPFGTLMVSLSATIGTGNIAGVATAIGLGGPGALFWMWFSALLGMGTKYAESVCAVHFREKNARDQYVGGPMYYIKNGMGRRWLWLAMLFAIFGALAGFGIGNAVQAHSVAESLQRAFGIDKVWSALLMMLVIALVLLGGLRGIARTATALVPFMSFFYLAAGLIVVIANLPAIPEALMLVVKTAFTGTAATGGFAGAAVALAIEKGVARGVFSNEAGLGSAPIAHAAAESNSAVEQGCVAMLGTFIDTLVICTVTGLAIVVTGVWDGDAKGAAMSQAAFASVLPFGEQIVALSLSLFAFTTILGWSYYSERCAEFLFKEKIVIFYRCLWVLVVPIGALMSLDMVWSIADILNGLMAIPNVIALFALSGLVVRLTREHFSADTNLKG